MATCIIRKCYSACSGHRTLELQLQVVCTLTQSIAAGCITHHHDNTGEVTGVCANGVLAAVEDGALCSITLHV